MPFISLTINTVAKDTGFALKDLLPFVTTLLGAFVGASLAFLISVIKDKRDEKNKQKSALVDALYVLASQLAIVEGINTNLLEPYKNMPDRHFELPYFQRSLGDRRLQLDHLTFILTIKTQGLLQDVHIAETNFIMCINLLEELNKYRTELQDKYPPVNFNPQTGVGILDIPPHKKHILKVLTNNLYNFIAIARPNLNNASDKLLQFYLANYKKCKKLSSVEEIKKNKPQYTTT